MYGLATSSSLLPACRRVTDKTYHADFAIEFLWMARALQVPHELLGAPLAVITGQAWQEEQWPPASAPGCLSYCRMQAGAGDNAGSRLGGRAVMCLTFCHLLQVALEALEQGISAYSFRNLNHEAAAATSA